ncbi:MAG: hypothetical protein WD039_09045, partial [Xanthobacteraceae bacterium]
TVTAHGGARLWVRASAGAAMLLPADTPADVIARADHAMYARKQARRPANLSAAVRQIRR